MSWSPLLGLIGLAQPSQPSLPQQPEPQQPLPLPSVLSPQSAVIIRIARLLGMHHLVAAVKRRGWNGQLTGGVLAFCVVLYVGYRALTLHPQTPSLVRRWWRALFGDPRSDEGDAAADCGDIHFADPSMFAFQHFVGELKRNREAPLKLALEELDRLAEALQSAAQRQGRLRDEVPAASGAVQSSDSVACTTIHGGSPFDWSSQLSHSNGMAASSGAVASMESPPTSWAVVGDSDMDHAAASLPAPTTVREIGTLQSISTGDEELYQQLEVEVQHLVERIKAKLVVAEELLTLLMMTIDDAPVSNRADLRAQRKEMLLATTRFADRIAAHASLLGGQMPAAPAKGSSVS